MIAEVTRQRGDTSAPKEFLKAYLIGRHADLSDNADAQKITDTPHIWVRDNPEKIDLNQDGEPYHAFVTELIDLGRAYGDLVAATVRPYHENESAALYYNRVNGVTAQLALILAAIQRGDTPSTIRAKARVAANFVDLLVVHRAIHDESTRPDDLNRAVLDAVPLVRDCNSAEELGAVLGAQLPHLDFDAILGFGLRGDNRAQVRYILARLTAYVQQAMDQENIIERYLAEERAWHIEHLFPDHPDWHPDLTPRQFRAVRNRIGGLGLLSAPDNTSVRDLPYEKKITWYRRHNALLAVLSAGYQQRNPALRKFRNSHRLEKLMHDFGPSPSLQEVVDTRGQLYHALAQHIWNPAKLGLTIPSPPQDDTVDAATQPIPAPPTRTPSSGRRTGLAALVTDGRIRPGTRLYGIHRGTRHEAWIDETGRIWLDDDSYRLPDDAAKTATGLKRCPGWKFWHINLTDGAAVPLGDFRDNSDLVAG
jgi:hypothetical protein